MSYTAALFTILGLILAGQKFRDCWIFFMIGNCFWLTYGVQSHQWPIVATDSIMLLINFHNARKWK